MALFIVAPYDLPMIGQRLKDARERLGLSLMKVYDFTGVDPSNLQRVEAGKLSPSDNMLKDLSKLYKMPFDQLKAWKVLSRLNEGVIAYIKTELCR